MKWIEIITLRCAGNIRRESVKDLLAETVGADPSTDSSKYLLEMKIIYHAVVETDLSIHIYWESERANLFKSPLAIRIYAALIGMGLLDYSVWNERFGGGFNHRPAKKTRGSNHTFSTNQYQHLTSNTGGNAMLQTIKEAQINPERLVTQLSEWGIDLKKFKVKAQESDGKVKEKLLNEIEALQAELNEGLKRLTELKESGNAASGELKEGIEDALDALRKSFDRAKAKFE